MMLKSCLKWVIEIQVNEDDKSDKWEFKAKERNLSRCKNYMYRRKKSAKLNKVLGSLKNARFSRRLSTLVTHEVIV